MGPLRLPASCAEECTLCPRLEAFRTLNRLQHPEWHNAPVEGFGCRDSSLLIVGLAPGLKGANRTGRPFTGDGAGDLLFSTLASFGLSRGVYGRHPHDGLALVGCRIVNAVRCVPPQNKPTLSEISTCRPFLLRAIEEMKHLRGILCLGRVSHDTTMKALGATPKAHYPFSHGRVHQCSVWVVDSYHCSRYNTSTKRLTPSMFQDVFRTVTGLLSA